MSTTYTYTRQDAAKFLGVSTRSVDRYIKSGKLRSIKDGKIVYVNEDDIKNLAGGNDSKQEIIENNKTEIIDNETKSEESTDLEVKSNFKIYALDKVYDDLRNEIKEKDETIKDLSVKLGRAEEIVRNSVSMLEFKRSQMLLEDSKTHLGSAISELKDKSENLERKLKHEKTTNYILIITVLILFTIAGTVWFVSI